MNKPKKHIFVCSSSRINGHQRGFCERKDSVRLIQNLMREVQEQDLSSEVIITNTGCLGICTQGPIVIVYPDAVWYGSVTPDDAAEIIESHILNDKVVDRLEI